MSFNEKFRIKENLPSYFVQELRFVYEEREARSIGNLVLEEISGKKLPFIINDGKTFWTGEELERIDKIIFGLRDGEPIQYILGHTEFFGFDFEVGPGVLIPRNETEELVDWVLRDHKSRDDYIRLIDLGCGSGVIPVSLAGSLANAEIYAADISDKALEMTVRNAEKNQVNLNCGRMDILNPEGYLSEIKYDVIVSNPPYVLESQKPFLEGRVSEKEPGIALFVPDFDPLVFYRAIAEFALTNLNKQGSIYVEINEDLPAETLREFQKYFPLSEVRKDIHGKYRMIRAQNG